MLNWMIKNVKKTIIGVLNHSINTNTFLFMFMFKNYVFQSLGALTVPRIGSIIACSSYATPGLLTGFLF